MSRLIFDLETDGLLDKLTKIHCIGIHDLDTDTYKSYGPLQVREAVARLGEASLIVGHNIIGFDIQAIQKLYPNWKPAGLVRDTLVLTRLIWPHIADADFRNPSFPKRLIGSQSLGAWGHRLGDYKGDYKGGWDTYSPAMHEYMDQDVHVTHTLWKRIEDELGKWGVPLEDPDPPPRKDCVELEHRVAHIVTLVERHGFAFSERSAIVLAADITKRKADIERELQRIFPPTIEEEEFVPKVNNKKLGYTKGVPITKTREVPFNPASRIQIGQRLQALGWRPQEFGKNGYPTVDEQTLRFIDLPQARLIVEYLTLDKRLGQIANGNEAWLRHAKNGRIHGRIQSGGAHTGRMTHSKPNMAQVPGKVNKKTGEPMLYGEECRRCFTADEGYVLVGCDADALELRDLAGYMALYDEGAYVNVVLKGDKKQGTDMHTINAGLIGCDRDTAKVFFYAMIYGAGYAKLGEILGGRPNKGKKAKDALMKGVPALGLIISAVGSKTKFRGYILGLDGRRLKARSENAAFNTLLQSAGAVQMKRALVLLYDRLEAKGWEFGKQYSIVGLIHDEWQANVLPELADEYGRAACQAIRDAGKFYDFRCPLDAQYSVGKDWSETH